jgi:hypothetical protein
MRGGAGLVVWMAGFQAADISAKTGDPALEGAVRRARQVVFARCVAAQVKAMPQYGGSPFTFYQFETQRVFRGSPGKAFTLRLFGGRTGNTVVSSEHVPEFVPNRQYVLLLGENNRDGFPLVTTGGIFEVVVEPDGKTRRVVPVGDYMSPGRELESFLSEIERLVKS